MQRCENIAAAANDFLLVPGVPLDMLTPLSLLRLICVGGG